MMAAGTTSSRVQYRPDIDGLRAIAIGAVVLCHAEVPGFDGGFVGVDVFFVISGFLITSIVADEIRHGSFSLAGFYARRARRLLPAFFAMLAASALAGAVLLESVDFARFGRTAAAATAVVANFMLWRESSYHAPSAQENPLLHTWSLSVEEQFYALFPLTLVLLVRAAGSRTKWWLMSALAASLGAAAWGIAYRPEAAFYLLPTRAWELLTGSLLALGALPPTESDRASTTAGGIGLLLIGISVVCYSETTGIPGFAALLPVAGAAMVVWSGSRDRATWTRRLLSTRMFVFPGLISYSLYLWHWPIIAFWRYVSNKPLTWIGSLAIVSLSFTLAVLSWRCVEQPIRKPKGFLASDRVTLRLAGVAMLAAIASGLGLWMSSGLPARFPEEASSVAIAEVARDRQTWARYEGWQLRTRDLGPTNSSGVPTIGEPGLLPSVMLFGDSHATALIPAIDEQCRRAGVASYVITEASAAPTLGVTVERVGRGRGRGEDDRRAQEVAEFLERNSEVRTVILAARWPAYIRGMYTERGEGRRTPAELFDGRQRSSDVKSREELLEAGLRRMVELLISMDRDVVLVGCVPEIGTDVPRAFVLARRMPWLVDFDNMGPTRAEFDRRQAEAMAMLSRVSRDPRVTLVRPDAVMWDVFGRAIVIRGDRLLYRDDDHLSGDGARHVAGSLDGVFDRIMRRGASSGVVRE
jgi:peptidoglycan/LPS O-acetylase OafA/YrhL